jgi:hypothetical protein
MSDDNLDNEFEPEENDHDNEHEHEKGAELEGTNREDIEDAYEFPPERPKRRSFFIVGTIVLVLLIIGGVIAARTVGRGLTGTVATPTPTLLPGENLFYITISPSWGTVAVDRHTISSLPVVGNTPLTLSVGTHEVAWNDPPFTQQKCYVTVPIQPNAGANACASNDSAQVQHGKDAGLTATIISFVATPAMLPADQHTALVGSIQAMLHALQSTSTVQPGEKFVNLNAPKFVATATQPLKATLKFQLETNPNTRAPCDPTFYSGISSCNLNGINCANLCDGSDLYYAPDYATHPQTTWDIFGILRITWDYSTMSGQVIAVNQPDIAVNTGLEYLFPLYVTWSDAHWNIALFPASGVDFSIPPNYLNCYPVQTLISGSNVEPSYFGISPANGFQSVTINGQIQNLNWVGTSSEKQQANGCLENIGIQQTNQNPSTPTVQSGPTAYCLYRFGVLLAVNDVAHRYWPFLPVANAYEQSIAHQLLQQQTG